MVDRIPRQSGVTTPGRTAPAARRGVVLLLASVLTLPVGLATAGPAPAATGEPPRITEVVPSRGPGFATNAVTITGTNFTGASSVTFGSNNAVSYTVDSDTTITAVVPATSCFADKGIGSITVGVTVTTPAGRSSREGGASASEMWTWECGPPSVTSVSPKTGLPAGGTVVTITGERFTAATAVEFGSRASASFHVVSDGEITATSPPGTGTVDVAVLNPEGTSEASPDDQFTYKVEHLDWEASGALAVKKLSQSITLPEGSTFNGNGELNTETGAGSVSGSLSIPAFTSSLKLFGGLPVSFGMTISQVGALEGTVAKSESVPGDETLTLPAKLNVGITSVSLLGLKVPTSCTTSEPMALNLIDNLTAEELLSKGWSFTGTTVLPRFACHGGFLGQLFGYVLSALLSGPENSYSLSVQAPVVDRFPPAFAGLKSATRCHGGAESSKEEISLQLAWEAATDDVTPSSEIVYNIYRASTAGGENFSHPTYTTAPGATEFQTPLLPYGTYYFVVRARDKSGLEDSNKVEKRGENLCV